MHINRQTILITIPISHVEEFQPENTKRANQKFELKQNRLRKTEMHV